jgi:primosomal protein N''
VQTKQENQTMKRFPVTAAAVTLLSASAFAQSSALDVRMSFQDLTPNDATIVDILMDETGKDREEADFQARMKAATPEQMTMMKEACTKAEQAKVGFSDMVSSRCKMMGSM